MFDIAHADLLSESIPEDWAFLISQRQKGRPDIVGPLSEIQGKWIEREKQRLDYEAKRRKRFIEEREASGSHVVLALETSSGMLYLRRKLYPLLMLLYHITSCQ